MLGPCPLCKKKLPSKDLETCCFFLRLRWTMMVWKLTTLSKSSRNCYYYIDKENKCHRLGTKHLSWCIYLESEVVDMCTNRSSFQNKTHKLETDSLSIGLSICSLVQSLYPSNKWEVHWAKYVLNRTTSQRRWKYWKLNWTHFWEIRHEILLYHLGSMPYEHVERGTIGSFVLVVIVTWRVARLEVYHFAKVHHEEGHPFLGVGHPIVQFINKWVSTYSPWWNMSHFSLISGEIAQWKSTILNRNATIMADFKTTALQSVGWSSSKAWILISVSLRCLFLVSWRLSL